MSLGDAFKQMIGLGDDDYDDEISEEEIQAEMAKMKKTESTHTTKTETTRREDVKIAPKADASYESIAPVISRGQQKAYSMNGSGPFKMLVIEPKSFDECTKLVDNLKSRKPVIINLEKVETDLARKMFDFMSGATYALNGNVQRVTSNIFIFAPANVDIAAKLNNQTQAQPQAQSEPTGYTGEAKSPWR